MRLLHIIHTLNPDLGGPSESVRMFVLAHQDAGNQVEVATLDDPANGHQSFVNCKVHPCGPGQTRWGFSPRLVRWLEQNYHRFDAVIVNGIWQYHAVAARKTLAGRKPYVVFAHGMLDPYFRHRYPLKHVKKLLYWILHEHRNLNGAEAVCFTSEEEKRTAGEGFPLKRFQRVVIPYGTSGPSGEPNQMKSAFLKEFPRLKGRAYLLYLSRIHPKKGCDLLLQAFAQVAPPELQLVMAGPDDVGWRSELEAHSERLGISSRVHWTGMLRGPEKWGAFYGAEAFILPSHQENFGIAVAEALSCGVISLMSDKINIARDIAADGAGIMEPDTSDGIRRLIQRFCNLSDAEKCLMRTRSLACYQNRYALRNAAREVYRALGIGRGER